LTLGAHNIKFPYLERSEYGEDTLENGDVFLKNTIGSIYNGSAIVFEGDRDMESVVSHVVRGNATAVEIEGLAAAIIMHKAGEMSGSGPAAGVIEVSDRVKSVAQFKNYFPKQGAIEFVFDTETNTFLVGKPKGPQGLLSPHESLANLIEAGTVGKSRYVGGMYQRDGNNILTSENSGHYGHNWTDQNRTQFIKFMEKNTGLKVKHEKW
jgi:hypothetical protein